MTLLEVGCSARNGPEHTRLLDTLPLARMIVEWDMPAAVTRRAYFDRIADLTSQPLCWLS
ncbi:hypothetical protein [Frankia gtarii]|uniref:hypothetical protein n=1 Tax=Frankia gtarii TaxID=2950102 RepID=UPI0021C168A0|nr:hypothetical protein [Frankia gtarii]